MDECDRVSPSACEEPILRLVALSEDLKELGILMVQTSDRELIARLRLRLPGPGVLPALGFYRNGDLLPFAGNVESETSVMKFLTDLDNILLTGAIEKVDTRCPTDNALLINFGLSSDAEIFVSKCRMSMRIGAVRPQKCVCNVYIFPTGLPFCIPPLLVG